jgi:hypothetical protein
MIFQKICGRSIGVVENAVLAFDDLAAPLKDRETDRNRALGQRTLKMGREMPPDGAVPSIQKVPHFVEKVQVAVGEKRTFLVLYRIGLIVCQWNLCGLNRAFAIYVWRLVRRRLTEKGNGWGILES